MSDGSPERIISLVANAHIFMAAAWTFLGLVTLLFGYRLLRVLAPFYGGYAGTVAAAVLLPEMVGAPPLLTYFLSLVAGGLGALVFYYLYVFLLGFVISAGTAYGLALLASVAAGEEAGRMSLPVLATATGLPGLFGGIAAVAFQRPFMVTVLSIFGALMALLGAAIAAGGAAFLTDLSIGQVLLAAAAWVALSAVGIWVQWTASRPDSDETTGKSAKGEKQAAG